MGVALSRFNFLAVIFLSLLSISAMSAPAPEWTLKDAQGEEVSLKDYDGKVLILHFWATWCPYCKRLQPGLDKLYKEYKEQGVELISISFAEDEGAQPQKSIDDRGHHFKTLLHGDEVAKKYQVSGTPTTFFIDKKGELVAVTHTSNPDEPGMRKIIEKLLK